MISAKEYLLEKYLPTTSPEERELWYKTTKWAPQVVEIMGNYIKDNWYPWSTETDQPNTQQDIKVEI